MCLRGLTPNIEPNVDEIYLETIELSLNFNFESEPLLFRDSKYGLTRHSERRKIRL